MKKIIFLVSCFLSIQGVISQSKGVDLPNAEVTFEFISKKVKGSLSDIKGTIVFDKNNLDGSSLKGSVAVKTLETGNFLRDGHLMWKKYFYQKKYPRIYFESSSITKKGDQYLVKGTFTIKGVSKQTNIEFKLENNILYGKAKVNSADFNINIDSDKEDNVVAVVFKFPLN
ncbi:hypothetical protein GTQ40_06435 [Flavobacteriaceae bacterium R38]|nr:hypothetical protein [Flavobacteriaceae bacterium R38]